MDRERGRRKRHIIIVRDDLPAVKMETVSKYLRKNLYRY